jgi:hypothetical protein
MSKIKINTFEQVINRANSFLESNEELWEEGMKPALLESKDFLDWYK